MSLLLKQLFNFFKLLNSETGTNQLAWGLSLGLVLGFSPFLSIQTMIVIFLCFFFRIQLGAAFLSAFFFKFIAYLLDPVTDQMGRMTLEADSLRPLFVELANMPLVPMTRFNNSIVMGSMILGFILSIPSFFVFKILIIKYREQVVNRFKETKIWKAWAATGVYKIYAKYTDLYQ